MKCNSEYPGLCANCLRAPECSFRVRHKDPVVFCEGFEYEKGLDSSAVNNLSAKSVSAINKDLESNGLCVNCRNKSVCSLRKINSEVSNCNEYELGD